MKKKKQKILFLLFTLLTLFTLVFWVSISTKDYAVIPDNKVPLASIKSAKAEFYINKTGKASAKVSYLQCKDVGSGEIYTSNIKSQLLDPDFDSLIKSEPNTDKYIDSETQYICWERIYYSLGKYRIIGVVLDSPIVEYEEPVPTEDVVTEDVVTEDVVVEDVVVENSVVPDSTEVIAPDSTFETEIKEEQEITQIVIDPVPEPATPEPETTIPLFTNERFLNEAGSYEGNITPAVTYYFSSDGNDSNSGTDPDNPKKNPTNILRNGNCRCLLRSGDVFTLNYGLAIGSNVIISTYGGSERAVISWVPTNSSPFELYDESNSIYVAVLDSLTDSHKNVAWLSINNSSNVNWHRVFDYNNLVNDNDFYCNENMLYIKSSEDLSGVYFSYGSAAGGLTFENGQNTLIENIEIVGGGIGINVKRYSNFICRNCYVHHNGGLAKINSKGEYYRYGNGIQIWTDGTNNIYIYNNVVSNCFDAGITPQISGSNTSPSNNVVIFDNYISDCLYAIEYFQHGTTSPTSNIIIYNNTLANVRDITNGYRYATYGYEAYFCMWSSKDKASSVYVYDNFGISNSYSAFSFYEDTPQGVNNFSNNTLIISGKNDINQSIKNIQYFTGSSTDILLLDFNDESFSNYYSTFQQRIAKYNTSSLFFR